MRLAPDHAATLFQLVKAEGMANTAVVVSGYTPAGQSPAVARRRAPVEETAAQPMQIAPDYGQPPPYGQQYYRQPQPYYAQQPYYGQPQPYYAGQPAYLPPQPPPPQYYVLRPYNPY